MQYKGFSYYGDPGFFDVHLVSDQTAQVEKVSHNKAFVTDTKPIEFYINIPIFKNYFYNSPLFFGVPDTSHSLDFYEVDFYGPDFKGYWTYKIQDYPYPTRVADGYAVGMNNRGYLIDSNVSSGSNVMVYGTNPVNISLASDIASPTSYSSTNNSANDSQQSLPNEVAPAAVIAGPNLQLTNNSALTLNAHDSETFALKSLPTGKAHATVVLNHIIDTNHEILSLKADSQNYPNILGASSSDGTLTLIGNQNTSLAEWEAALKAVTYQNTAAHPSEGVRTVTYDFNDGEHISYASAQDYIVIPGTVDGRLLRTSLEPNDPNFKGMMIAFDTGAGQNAGTAFRMYGIFDRAPDLQGLGFWINSFDHGADLPDVASSFIASPEFAAMYGANSTDTNFVTLLYNHVLDRDPDSEGNAYWLNALNNGMTRGAVLASFSESPENLAQTAPLIANGIQYQEWVG